MTAYFLASAPEAPAYLPPPPAYAIPTLTLESMDGLQKIPLDGTAGWIRMPGATGLEMAPVEQVAKRLPGVYGAVPAETRVLTRPVFLPIYCGADRDHVAFLRMKDQLRKLIDPLTGTFRIVGRTARSDRELVVSYDSGLEGSDSVDTEGLTWGKIGLNATANHPFATARADTTLEFRTPSTGAPFLGVVGGTDARWPGLMSSGSVIGSNMPISVDSDVPLFPVLELVGPMDSFVGDLAPTVVNADGTTKTLTDQAWHVEIPTGVPAGSTFRMVTDPRFRSIRLDGLPAAGRVALGSSLRPFYPGTNTLNVAAPGGNSNTRIRLSWRKQFWSLW